MTQVAKINRKIDQLQFSYFGIMSVSLLAGTCFASIVLFVLLMMNAPVWQIAVLASVAMASNATAISHSPLRWVVWLAAINILTGLLLVVLNLF